MTDRLDELQRYHGGCDAAACGLRWLLDLQTEKDHAIAELMRQVHTMADQIEAMRKRAA